MKRTPWYPVSINPVRAGLYGVRGYGIDEPLLMEWTGGGWGKFDRRGFITFGYLKSDQWRGLTKEHK